MHYSQLLAVSALAVLGAATPTPAKIAPRACTTQLPSYYQKMSEASPIENYPQNGVFQASQDKDGANEFVTIVHFQGVRNGSYACQLNIAFDSTKDMASSGKTLLYVYIVSKPASANDTFSTVLSNSEDTPVGSLWGAGTIREATMVMNSRSCASNLVFLVRIASDYEAGSVAYTDDSALDGPRING
ncbi:MAG: hypothetical protein Q9187_006271, partial [Circinaria calcarea]